jgi:putative phosphoesterase
MRIGIFADAHDHADNIRRAVSEFNNLKCELVVFAGDLVSPMSVPPLRKLRCPLLACFGDNDGNKVGIAGGMRIVGTLGEPPFGFQTPDGTRVLVTHVLEQLRGMIDGAHVVISAHTHRGSIREDEAGRLFINPGETSGWTFRKPTIAVLETSPISARLIALPELPSNPVDE